MPYGFGTTLISVAKSGTSVTFSGQNFAENQFDGLVWLRLNGGVTKIYPNSYTSWSNTVVIAIFSSLVFGSYDGGVTSGSDEASNELLNALSVLVRRHPSLMYQDMALI
jgi:hypothetical protein